MKRKAENDLDTWLGQTNRKPLVIRGARQVGKSTLVRQFAKNRGLKLVEVNLEREPKLLSAFKSLNPQKIAADIELITQKKITDKTSLLFLDELQAIPESLASLRYFYEERPQLPLIGAGSLLEFILSDHSFSMPVGRVEYFHLGPMTFKEFLLALNEMQLLEILESLTSNQPPSEIAHSQLLERLQEYFFIGGMPEAVLAFSQTRDFSEVRRVQRNLVETYRSDFSKYRQRVPLTRLDRVFEYAAIASGEKVKYSNISTTEQARELRAAIELLEKARVLYRVHHTHCSGLPLRSGMNSSVYKLLFLDVGLMNQMIGLDWQALKNLEHSKLLPLGKITEQFAGQHLLYLKQNLEVPELYYWLREGRANNAEVDFVLQVGTQILPIEVKAGKTGALKSLLQFVMEQKVPDAVKLDLRPPSDQRISQKQGHTKQMINFKLLALPLYAIEELPRLMGLDRSHPAAPISSHA